MKTSSLNNFLLVFNFSLMYLASALRIIIAEKYVFHSDSGDKKIPQVEFGNHIHLHSFEFIFDTESREIESGLSELLLA